MSTTHRFNDHFAPDSFRCKCGAETDRRDKERREKEECPARVREEAERLATDPIGAFAQAKTVEFLRGRLRAEEAKLKQMRATCDHDWSEAKYTPEVREAYTIEGDPPGTMGIDWRGPQHVPRQETPKWTRTCRRCGKTETTNQVTEKVTRTPRF